MCIEYEVKKHWTGAMTTAKNEVFIGLSPENFCLVVGEISLWWGQLFFFFFFQALQKHQLFKLLRWKTKV